MLDTIKGNSKFWRYLTNFWTITLYVIIILDFMESNAYQALIGTVAAIYTACLAIYSADKEFERWHHHQNGRHPGETYVIIWSVLLVTIVFAEILFPHNYRVPSEVVATYIAVLSILVLTKKSGRLYKEKKAK